MKEPSARTSEILEVTFRKKKVTLVFARFSVEISASAYSDGFYYPGKKLTPKEVQVLRQEGRLCKAEGYLAKQLSSHRMTEKMCRDRLAKYSLSQADIDRLLKPYREAKILDDGLYCQDFIQDKIEKGYGKRRILSELARKGISKEILESSDIQSCFEEEDIPERLLSSLFKKNGQRTLLVAKEKSLEALIRRGYDSSVARKAIEDYLSTHVPDSEAEGRKREALLRKEAEKCYNQQAKRNTDARKKLEGFTNRLLRLGFRREEIIRIKEERHYTFK